MNKQIIVDGCVYNLNSIGLYEPESPYAIDASKWLLQVEHNGFTLITKVKDGITVPYLLSNGTENREVLDSWWMSHRNDKPDGCKLGILICGEKGNFLGGASLWGVI